MNKLDRKPDKEIRTGCPAHIRAGTRVDIYVSEGCHNCNYAKEVARVIRRDFPTVQVQLIDIFAPSEPLPEAVFATPTYLLNGHLWSLGNPSSQDVRERLSAALTASSCGMQNE